jgi:hypothetical protein
MPLLVSLCRRVRKDTSIILEKKKKKPPNVEVARRKKSGSPIMCPTGASTTFALYHQQQEVACFGMGRGNGLGRRNKINIDWYKKYTSRYGYVDGALVACPRTLDG